MDTTFQNGFDEAALRERIAAKRRRNNWLAVLLIAVPAFWAVPTYLYMRSATHSVNSRCEENLSSLGRAVTQYVEAHDGKLPIARNWIEALDPSAKALHCPARSGSAGSASYAMNANLSGKKLDEIKDPANTILLYETTSKASTPFGTGEDMVKIGKDTVGVGRHNTIAYRFNYFLMADGTVRAPKNVAEAKKYKWTP